MTSSARPFPDAAREALAGPPLRRHHRKGPPPQPNPRAA
ncbi:MAG: hypothetical protein QOG11_1709, partial [Solirubrobacteraceae bacterium]|nr:hypothetical protein [Solirubrobacteraceae bacterium]